MSNVAENELKNAQNGLKNSIEKLKSELVKVEREVDYYGYGESWRTPEVMRRDMMRWEFDRQMRELAVLDYLIELSAPITFEVSGEIPDIYPGSPQSYWEIAEAFRKHPTINASTTGADWMNDL